MTQKSHLVCLCCKEKFELFGPNNNCIRNASFGFLRPGFGSRYDAAGSFAFIICDDCLKKNISDTQTFTIHRKEELEIFADANLEDLEGAEVEVEDHE